MRWNLALNIVLLGINIAFSQTYIVKFKSDRLDSALMFSSLNETLKKIKTANNQPSSFSIQPLNSNGVPTKSKFPWKRFSIIKFSQQQSEQFITSLSNNSLVEYIQPNYTYKVYSVPNDSAYPSQWNLRRIGISSLFESGVIHSSLPMVKVGVIDTGIDEKHPDLLNAIALNFGEIGSGKETNGIDDDENGFIDDWRGYDFVESETEDVGDWQERDNDPADEHGHGTSVSGIIGAQTNNAIGLVGIFPVKILPLRAFGKNGNGNDIDIASAIVYAVDNGVDVINMSFGDVVQSPFLHEAIRYAYFQNVILVASSGNDGTNYPHYPSDFSEVISTSSVGQYNARSFFSSYSSSLDIMAPGEQIVTTTLSGGYTDQFAGTSAAAPHVSGVAALLKSLEKEKKKNQPTYVERSNEEIRGILLNSADDAGEKGWDKFYGAGIVNAVNAIQMVSGATVVIHSPKLDEIFSENFKDIIVSASSPYLQSVQLYYGRGENPTTWNLISTIDNKVLLQDTLRFLDKILFPNDFYILRLVVKNSKGNDVEFRQRIIIDSSIPKILSFHFRDSVIIGSDYGALIEARIDRNSTGTLYYRKVGETSYKSIQSLGLQLNHSFVLSKKNLIPSTEYEFFCEFSEYSTSKRSVKFPTIPLAGTDRFSVKISPQEIATTGFDIKPYSFPKGYLLNSVIPVSGLPVLVANEYDTENNFGKLKAYEFAGNKFTVKDSSVRSWVPRSFIKNNGEGKSTILVQDRGISQLLQIDTVTGNFFNKPIWGDSTDIWASQLVDLDSDNKPEIIARSSSEFLIYKNLGNNNFSIVNRLSNPTSPLAGEARNQFGPPKSIIGDFTYSGRKEIIFADYDGDVIMYRQISANSLNFEITGIDTSTLNEMSDYITSGDFNGDGILDFAVAGHSNLDWNQDREYDVPVWTVRVFSHSANDPAGSVSKIWQQDFIGVKSGSGYDNGLSAGKIKTNDTKDVLFISFNPQLYIFEWNNAKNEFESKWFHQSVSNSVIGYDFDGDSYTDFGFHTNGKVEFWSSQQSSTVLSPFGIKVVPLTPTKVNLQWSSFSSIHNIYRGTNPDTLSQIKTVSGNEWIDSTVSMNVKYYYAVSSVGISESKKSTTVSVIPHTAAVIDSIIQASLTQLIVHFSYDISSDNISTTRLLLDSTLESISIVWRNSRSVIATFPNSFSIGNHTLKILQMSDISGMDADTIHYISFLTNLQIQKEFFVRSIKLISSTKIQIDFSDVPDFTTAKNITHYTVKTIAKQFSIISVDSILPESILLTMVSGSNLSSLALRLEVSISDSIISFNGRRLNSGKGQTLSIAQETNSIDKIVVYPNPVKYSKFVSFVNIPKDCRITIYSIDGEKIKVFENVTTGEGISWDMRSTLGDHISTGVYLYRVEQLNAANESTNTILGKFAVIR